VEGIGVEGRVGEQDLGGQASDKRLGLRHLVRLAGSEADVQQVAELPRQVPPRRLRLRRRPHRRRQPGQAGVFFEAAK
jgi:hypothetical protein